MLKPVNHRIPRWFQNTLFFGLAISWLSGIGFYILSRWITIEGDFGPEKHPAQFVFLQFHGLVAFLMMMCIGALLASHVLSVWRQNKMRRLGLVLVTGVCLQVVSAYLLYYIAEEDFRFWLANFHALLGVSLPAILFSHVWLVRRDRVAA